MKKTVILAVTRKGRLLAELIEKNLPGSEIYAYQHGFRKALEDVWHDCDGIICVMATGIVVRCLGGLCRSKYHDPSVVVVDETGRHAISLLSGHIGGANELAEVVASICGGRPVITTASDVSGHTAIDLWTIEENLAVANPERFSSITARLLDKGIVNVYQQKNFIKTLPEDFRACTNPHDADIVIALNVSEEPQGLILVPRINHIGFGCRRGATVDEFETVLADLRDNNGIDPGSVAGIASIDIKKDEDGLLQIGQRYNWPVRFFTKEQINSVPVPSRSETVHRKIGVFGVCEAAALMAASSGERKGRLIIKKIKWERITAAVAQTEF